MKQYKHIFIDFDDTLYDTRGNAIISLAEMFDYFHLEKHFDDANVFYDNYWKTNVALWAQYSKAEITRDYLMVERFRRPLSLGKGLEDVDAEFCMKVSDKFLEFCSCKPGLVDGARDLVGHLYNKGYHLSLCSNGFHEVQYKKLRACGLFDFFEHIILSEDAGANKPSKQFFDYAFNETGATVSDTIMIGDNYVTDIEGAMDAGLDTILFNRWDPTFEPPRKPTHIVAQLAVIKSIL